MNSSNTTRIINETASNDSTNNTADIIQILLFIFVLVLSSVHIILVLSQKILRTNKFNWLTLNVCFASIFFSFIQLISTGFRLNDTSETTVSCRSQGFIVNMATCHIMYTHCTASFCRLLPVQYPQKLFFRSWYWLLSNMSIVWLVGIIFSLPYLFFDGFSCSSTYGKRFLQIYSSLITILLPIIIVTVCNITVFRYVRQSSKRIQDLNNNTNQQLNKRDLYLCKIVLITFFIFVIGWTPLFIQQLFFNDRVRLPSGVSTFFRLLPPMSLLADAILLIYSDQPVRALLLKILRCHRANPV